MVLIKYILVESRFVATYSYCWFKRKRLIIVLNGNVVCNTLTKYNSFLQSFEVLKYCLQECHVQRGVNMKDYFNLGKLVFF